MYLSYHSFSQVMLYPDPVRCHNSTLKKLHQMGIIAAKAMRNANGGKRDYNIGSIDEMLSVGSNTTYKASGTRLNMIEGLIYNIIIKYKNITVASIDNFIPHTS